MGVLLANKGSEQYKVRQYKSSKSCIRLVQEWGLDVTKSSFLSGLPWALSFALANLAGWSADSLINKKLLSITATRKLMQGIASLGPATCLTFLAMQKSGPGIALFPAASDQTPCQA